MILVTGATGNVGSELVKQLVDGGHDVRAYIRNPDKASMLPDAAEIAIGDLDDTAALNKAAEGRTSSSSCRPPRCPPRRRKLWTPPKRAG